MPVFRVHLTKMVEMVSTVEVDAPSRDRAMRRATLLASGPEFGTVTWVYGDDEEDAEVYAVHDENDDLVYER